MNMNYAMIEVVFMFSTVLAILDHFALLYTLFEKGGPLGLVIMYKKQKNFEVKMRQRGLINMQNKRIIY